DRIADAVTIQPDGMAVLQHMQDRHPSVPGAAWAAADIAIGFEGTGSGPEFQAALVGSEDRFMREIHQATHALIECGHPLEEVPLVLPHAAGDSAPADGRLQGGPGPAPGPA